MLRLNDWSPVTGNIVTNRSLLAVAAPKWMAIESLTGEFNKLDTLAVYCECVAHAIRLDHIGQSPLRAVHRLRNPSACARPVLRRAVDCSQCTPMARRR